MRTGFCLTAGALLFSACAASSWTTHRDPLGFSLDLPPGWTVSADRASGRIMASAAGQSLVIWPVFVPAPLDAASAGPVLRRLAAAAGVAATGAPEPAGAQAARMISRTAGRVTVAAFAWQPSPRGAAGWFYAANAPEASFRAAEPLFARMLSSFRVAGAPVAAAPALQFTRWQDPRESAFSVELPAGWRIQGGLFRFASVDTRTAFEAVSPDGAIRIAGGDAALPTFTEPTQMLAMTGFHEGSWYSPGYGVNMMVRRFLPGAAFVREYLTSRLARQCPGLRITDNRERPDATAALNAIYQQFPSMGVSHYSAAGEARFTCAQGEGYYFSATHLVRTAGMPGGLWFSEYLYGFLAASGKTAAAQDALNHALATFQPNPQWVAMQQNIPADTSRIVSRTQQEISGIITSTFENRQQVMDEIGRRRSNATLGVVDVIDPQTGREIKVENSSNYYWIDPRGQIVGTQTDTRPTLDYRSLIQLP